MAKRSRRFPFRLSPTGILFPTSVGLTLFWFVMQWVATCGNPLIVRYLAGHWVNKTTTALSLIGLIALIQAALRTLRQFTDTTEYAPPRLEADSSQDAVAR